MPAAVSLRCPKCRALLKFATRPTEGRKVKCPKCAAVFVAADQEASNPSTAIKSPSNRPAVPAASKGRPTREDDDEDQPRRSRKKIQKSNAGLIIGLCVGGVLLIALAFTAGGLFLYWSLGKSQSTPVAVSPEVQPIVEQANKAPKADAPGNAKVERPPAPAPVAKNPDNKIKKRPPKLNPMPPAPAPNPPQAPAPAPEPPQAPAKPPDPPPQQVPQPVAGPVDLDKDLLAKTTRATAFIRVSVGNQTSTGSGFLVKSAGDTAYVITNFHVIDLEEKAAPQQGGRTFRIGPQIFSSGPVRGRPSPPKPKSRPKVTVVLNSGTPDEQAISAEVVATDEESDLAALRVTGARNLPAALDVSQEPFLAEQQSVYIFGFPANKRPAGAGHPSVTVGKGTIAGLRRNVNNELIDVHINGDLNPGNSGGPIIDANGRLVGIAVAAVLGKQIGFAIPVGVLQQMFKGRLSNGLVVHLKQSGPRLDMIGEVWLHDHKGSVAARKAISTTLGDAPKGGRLPAEEYIVLARLADPMLKIKDVKAYVAMTENVPPQPGDQGWNQLARATPVSLKIEDQIAIGTYKLPKGVVPDRMFAFQFSYVNADNKTIFTQPHLVRLTFPQNTLSVTLNITGIADEPTRRYIEDTAPKLLPGKVRVVSRTKDALTLEVDPVPDPNALKEKITFGEVTSVQGRTFAVTAKKIDLPPPTADEVAKALEGLRSKDKRQRIASADQLAKVYVILPDRRAEVAKALEPLAGDKDIWVANPALRALALWGGPENIDAVLPALDNNFTSGEAIKFLSKFKEAKVADALAKALANGIARGPASAALKQMGPIAEKAVIPYVNNKGFFIAMEACHILKEIGTAECIPTLTQAVNDPKFAAKGAAQEALKAVQTRLKGGRRAATRP